MANAGQSVDSKKPSARDLLVTIVELMVEQNLQLKLFNARFEEVHNTSINLEEIENDTDNG